MDKVEKYPGNQVVDSPCFDSFSHRKRNYDPIRDTVNISRRSDRELCDLLRNGKIEYGEAIGQGLDSEVAIAIVRARYQKNQIPPQEDTNTGIKRSVSIKLCYVNVLSSGANLWNLSSIVDEQARQLKMEIINQYRSGEISLDEALSRGVSRLELSFFSEK